MDTLCRNEVALYKQLGELTNFYVELFEGAE